MSPAIEIRGKNTNVGKQRGIEALVFLILGIGFLAFGPPRIHLALLNDIHSSSLWQKRSEAFAQLAVFYGVAFLFLAILSFICVRRGATLTGRVMPFLRTPPRAVRDLSADRPSAGVLPRRPGLWLAAAILIGAGARGFFLSAPMRWDESFTFLQYIQSPFTSLFEYTAPNNHVLNSILEKISTLVLGNHPFSIRLPAFLAGVLSIPLSFRVCRALTPGPSGYFAAATVAVCPYLVINSANGRGYSLVVLLTLILVLIGYQYVKNPTPAGVGLIAITAALGLYTMPSMLFMVAGAAMWITCLLLVGGKSPKSVLFEFVIPCGGLTAALTALLYTPVVLASGGFEYILHNRFVRPQPWHEFLSQLTPHLRQTTIAFASGIPSLALVAVAVLIVAGFYASVRNRNWPLCMLLPLILASLVVILLAEHHIPFERTWIFLLPLIILVADAGFAAALESFPPRFRSSLIGALFLLVATLGVRLIASDPAAVDSTVAGGDFPEARVAAQFLQPMLMPGDAVRTSLSAEQPTFFYLWYDTSVVNPRTQKSIKPQPLFFMGDQAMHYSFMSYGGVDNPRMPVTTEPPRVFYVLKKSECRLDVLPSIHILVQANEILDLPAKKVVKLLDYGDMVVYRQISTGSTDGDRVASVQP
jgi:hypothetical protein